MTGPENRLYAIQGKKDLEQSRFAHAVENMRFNKAYRYAVEAAGGDPDESMLKSFVERFAGYRKGWRGNPRFAIQNKMHSDFYARTGWGPLCVDIEVAAACDLACPFCYRQWIATPDKIMGKDLFYRLIDQCSELNVPSVKLNWRGEPLLHPLLPQFVDYAKKKGVLETIINTDAVTLTAEKSKALIDAGLDLIIYSFDGGSKKTYESMRPGRFKNNRFEDVYGNIRRFAEIRSKKGAHFPRTKIQMILTETTYHEQESFFNLFNDCVDDVSVKAYTERGGELPELDSESLERVKVFLKERNLAPNVPYWRDMDGNIYVSGGRLACEQIYQRLMVTYDGRVSMCCYDWGSEYPIGYVDSLPMEEGDIQYTAVIEKARTRSTGFERLKRIQMPSRYVQPLQRVQTLREIWDNEIVNKVRKHHVEGNLEKIPICKTCMFKETHQWFRVDLPKHTV